MGSSCAWQRYTIQTTAHCAHDHETRLRPHVPIYVRSIAVSCVVCRRARRHELRAVAYDTCGHLASGTGARTHVTHDDT
eukprot:scaffold21954_cov146-Isochrysis_galbana.AAC.5